MVDATKKFKVQTTPDPSFEDGLQPHYRITLKNHLNQLVLDTFVQTKQGLPPLSLYWYKDRVCCPDFQVDTYEAMKKAASGFRTIIGIGLISGAVRASATYHECHKKPVKQKVCRKNIVKA